MPPRLDNDFKPLPGLHADDIVNVKTLAEHLAVNPETVLRWIRHESFPAVQFAKGGAYRVQVGAARRWLMNRAMKQSYRARAKRAAANA